MFQCSAFAFQLGIGSIGENVYTSSSCEKPSTAPKLSVLPHLLSEAEVEMNLGYLPFPRGYVSGHTRGMVDQISMCEHKIAEQKNISQYDPKVSVDHSEVGCRPVGK